MQKPRVLCVIPARGGSKRIKGKNVRPFFGTPLITHAIKQAQSLPFVDRIIVDTDTPEIAAIAEKAGISVPFLRPAHLAKDSSQVIDSITHLLARLNTEERYVPDYILVLQTTSPLREISDITACWKLIRKGGATTVLTVAPTHPRLYHLDKKGFISLANKSATESTNMQAWPHGYLLNGCFAYIVATKALLKERAIITKKTKAVVCPAWRSVDLDTPEDWVMAELLYKNKDAIAARIKNFS